MSKLIRLPQVIVAWSLNIVAIAIMAVGIILRIIAEWVYGSAPYESPKFYTQEGELTPEDLARIIQDNYEADEDGGASQEDFENYLDTHDEDKKVH